MTNSLIRVKKIGKNYTMIEDMKEIRLIAILFLITVVSCKSSSHLPKDISEENFSLILKCSKLIEGDSIWISKNTICIKESVNSVKLGRKNKWFHYFVINDTIDCYLIEKISKNDTLKIYTSYQNPKYW